MVFMAFFINPMIMRNAAPDHDLFKQHEQKQCTYEDQGHDVLVGDLGPVGFRQDVNNSITDKCPARQ